MPDLMYCAVKALIGRNGRFLFLVYSDTSNVDLPGGRLEEGEDPYEALKREVLEETGFNVKIGKPLGMYTAAVPRDPNRVVLTVFECSTPSKSEPHNSSSDEIACFKWLTLEEAIKSKLTDESMRRVLKNYSDSLR